MMANRHQHHITTATILNNPATATIAEKATAVASAQRMGKHALSASVYTM